MGRLHPLPLGTLRHSHFGVTPECRRYRDTGMKIADGPSRKQMVTSYAVFTGATQGNWWWHPAHPVVELTRVK